MRTLRWLVIWSVAGEARQEEFVYEYNARQWVRFVWLAWGAEATVQEVGR